MKHTFVLAAAVAVAAAHPAAAQIRIPPVRLIAGIGGVDGETVDIYSTTPTGPRYFTMHHPATALQLGLETSSPIRGVDLRLNLQHSNPQLKLGQIGTVEQPAAGAEDVYRTGVNTLTLDAAIHLPRVLDSTPYLLVGAGIKHFDFKQSYFRDSNQPFVPEDRSEAVGHLGLGTAWNVGRYDLFVEGSALLTNFRAPYTGNFDPIPGRREWSFTAGLKIPLHR